MEIFKEGLLEKRQRGLNHRNATHLKFQKRYFKLTTDGMAYYDEKKVLYFTQVMTRIVIIQIARAEENSPT